MSSSRDDVLALLDFAFERLRDRLQGLTDDEWRWQPTADDRITLRWRLEHIASFLGEDRNPAWLGLDTAPWSGNPSGASAAEALTLVDDSFAHLRGLVAHTDVTSFEEPIGAVAGPYGDATRRSFALHVADELIHHGASGIAPRSVRRSQLIVSRPAGATDRSIASGRCHELATAGGRTDRRMRHHVRRIAISGSPASDLYGTVARSARNVDPPCSVLAAPLSDRHAAMGGFDAWEPAGRRHQALFRLIHW